MAQLADKLEAAADSSDVVRAICADAAEAVGLDYVDLGVVRGQTLVSAQDEWPLDADFRDRYGVTPLEMHLPTTEAARSGELVIVPDLIDYQDGFPELAADVVASGFRTAVVAPFRDGHGAVLGVLGFVALEPDCADDEIIAAARVAAALCGASLQRTEGGASATAIAELAGRLAASLTTEDVSTAIRDHGAAALGATRVDCRIPDQHGLVAAAPSALPHEIAVRYRTVAVDGETPVGDAVRGGQLVWLDSPAAIARDYPKVALDAKTVALEAMCAVPIRDSRQEVIAALAISWSKPTVRDPIFESRVQTVAGLAAQALERARAYDAQHELVVRIQRRLIRPLVAPTGVEVAHRYVPAGLSAGVGGDWFDLVDQADGFAAVMADVAGHGIDAVTEMAQLRTALLGLLRTGEPLDSLFDRVDVMLEEPTRSMATSAVVRVDLAERQYTYTSAGHPPPLLRRSDGTVELLDQSLQTPVGAPRVRATPASCEVRSGDVLVLYTDGLVESRTEAVTDGITRLANTLSASDWRSMEEIADALVHSRPASAAVDDMAVLVLRFR